MPDTVCDHRCNGRSALEANLQDSFRDDDECSKVSVSTYRYRSTRITHVPVPVLKDFKTLRFSTEQYCTVKKEDILIISLDFNESQVRHDKSEF